MWTIEKDFTFDSAHRLPSVPEGHKCGRMHGHTYKLTVILASRELADGMVFEYGELKDVVQPLVDSIDHRTLNEIAGLENPTTEVLAEWIYKKLRPRLLKVLVAVRVRESSTTSCEYRPS
jgi:6-pyruvoyltetrahydropterin/6-carboxytetrahydropterin synthase